MRAARDAPLRLSLSEGMRSFFYYPMDRCHSWQESVVFCRWHQDDAYYTKILQSRTRI